MNFNALVYFVALAFILFNLPKSYQILEFSKLFRLAKNDPFFNISSVLISRPSPLLDAMRQSNVTSFYTHYPYQLNITSIRQLIKEIFFHGWDNYLRFAYPHDDLMPISCSGVKSQGEYYLTLIDAADTLAIMDELNDFEVAVKLIQKIPNFNLNINVSVFETTIRILGGLISTHILAQERLPNYDGGLLPLAQDLGNRLLWAFNSSSSIPYGTVNLMYGIPPKETPVVCTACATTLILEFGYLSHLLGDLKYYEAAKLAITQIWSHRSSLDLLGKHFDTEDEIWTETVSGISGQIDSFYEYLLKAYTIFHDPTFYDVFLRAYHAIEKKGNIDGYHLNVDMNNGRIQSFSVSSLQAFWPGLQATFGDLSLSAASLKKFIKLHKKYPFFPELVSILDFKLVGNNDYPLRPELIESVYFFHSVTKNQNLQHFAFELIERLVQLSYTTCGFATIRDVRTLKKSDHMESFFLSETVKYLYLLFDPNNYLHLSPDWVFTTEAHPLRVLPNTRLFFNLTPEQDFYTGFCPKNPAPPDPHFKASWLLEHCDRNEFEEAKRNWTFFSGLN